MLILDSNTISYYLRGDPQVVPRSQALSPAELGVPAVVEYELRFGLMRLPQEAAVPRLAALERLLRPMQSLHRLTANVRPTPRGCVPCWRLRAPPLAPTTR